MTDLQVCAESRLRRNFLAKINVFRKFLSEREKDANQNLKSSVSTKFLLFLLSFVRSLQPAIAILLFLSLLLSRTVRKIDTLKATHLPHIHTLSLFFFSHFPDIQLVGLVGWLAALLKGCCTLKLFFASAQQSSSCSRQNRANLFPV